MDQLVLNDLDHQAEGLASCSKLASCHIGTAGNIVFSSQWSYSTGVVFALKQLFKYLETLCPFYGCHGRLVENFAFDYEAIECSQSNRFQLRWNANVGAHDLGMDDKVGSEVLDLSVLPGG